VYNHGALTSSTRSTARGDWSLDQLPLREGDNSFQVKAYTQLGLIYLQGSDTEKSKDKEGLESTLVT